MEEPSRAGSVEYERYEKVALDSDNTDKEDMSVKDVLSSTSVSSPPSSCQLSGSSHIPIRKWTQEEIRAVEKMLTNYITSWKVPGKASCLQCIKTSPAAPKGRSWRGVKFYVKNRIDASKRESSKLRFYGRRKRRRRAARMKEKGEENEAEEAKTTPPRVDSPVDLKPSVSMEETSTTLSPPVPKEGEPLSEEAETETKTVKLETTNRPNKETPPFQIPAGIPKIDKRIPVVLLKPVCAPGSQYQCDLCNQKFSIASQLVKHKLLHEEEKSFTCEICGKLFTIREDLTEHQRDHEPSFPCNVCDRSFTTSQNLKRHKLLHVKDGRKCRQCGILFCRRHNHVAFQPQSESEQDSSMIESQDFDSDSIPENEVNEVAQSAMNVTLLQTTTSAQNLLPPPNPGLLSKTPNLSPASHTRILKEIPVPVLRKPSYVPPPPSVPIYSRNYPSTFNQPHLLQPPEFPPLLKMFSPQYLTSAFLEVKRNYEYILSKPIVQKEKDIVKEEQCELPLNPPDLPSNPPDLPLNPPDLPLNPPKKQKTKHVKKQKTAYDLEIML